MGTGVVTTGCHDSALLRVKTPATLCLTTRGDLKDRAPEMNSCQHGVARVPSRYDFLCGENREKEQSTDLLGLCQEIPRLKTQK